MVLFNSTLRVLTVFNFISTSLICASVEEYEEEEEDQEDHFDDRSSIDWCKLPCANGKTNVACASALPDIPPNCFGATSSTTGLMRKELLMLHNNARNYVAEGKVKGLPPAANMRLMTWDVELEASATAWSTTCIVGHAECRRTTQFEIVGQNYYLEGDDSGANSVYPENLKLAFQDWAIERIRVKKETIANYTTTEEGKSVANFMNIVAADSHSLGCATAHYIQGGIKFQALICNYGPGLVQGQTVYDAGPPCSRCPNATECDNTTDASYPGLCATSEETGDDDDYIDTDDDVYTLLGINGAVQCSLERISWTVRILIFSTYNLKIRHFFVGK